MSDKTKIDWCTYIPRGRKVIDKSGYVLVYCPEHPNANKGSGKYIYEHRLIMSNYLKRKLLPFEQVHHINGIRTDNRIENLSLISPCDHGKFHIAHRSEDLQNKFYEGSRKYSKSIKKSRDLVPCACGCGCMIECHDSKGRPRKYAHGHNNKGMTWKWGEHAHV